MRHYELVLLVHPDQSEQLQDMLKRYQDMITKNGGQIHRVEDIGRIQLAYTIQDMHKAHYVLMNIECDDPTITEIETSFKYNDSIMRHLCLRMKKAETETSKLYQIHKKEDKKGKYTAKNKEEKKIAEPKEEKKTIETEETKKESSDDEKIESESIETEKKAATNEKA